MPAQTQHQEIITIQVASNLSFEDAIAQGLREAQQMHPELYLGKYEVKRMKGTISYTATGQPGALPGAVSAGIGFYEVELEVQGFHTGLLPGQQPQQPGQQPGQQLPR